MGRKGKELSSDIKDLIVSLDQNGHRIIEISRLLTIPNTTTYGVIKQFKERECVQNRQRNGRPSLLSERGKRHLERIVKSNRRNSFQAICHEFNDGKKQILSKRTIQRKLHESGFKKR